MSNSKDARQRKGSPKRKAGKPKAQLEFVKLSMKLARLHLSPYGSCKSRHDFTQPQLMTCLVLRTYWKTTYRGVIEQLEVIGELRRAMGLRQLPNYSTLNKFAHRAGVLEVLDGVLSTLAKAAEEADDTACREAAMDATGLETSSASVTFCGDLILDSQISTVIELAGLIPVSEHDQFDIAGLLSLDGTLGVTLINGYVPGGDSYDVLDFGSITGSFDTVNLPALSGNLEWNVSNLFLDGTLSIAATTTSKATTSSASRT